MTVYNALSVDDDAAYKLIDGCRAEMEMPRRMQQQQQQQLQQKQQQKQQLQQHVGCGRRDNTDMDALLGLRSRCGARK